MIESLPRSGDWLGVWLAVALLLSLGAAPLYPLFRRLFARCRPAIRSAATLAYGLMPPAAAALAVAALLQPGFAALLVPAHCHGTFCGAHEPMLQPDSLSGLMLAAGGSVALLALGGGILWALAASRRRLRTLLAFSRPGGALPYRTVDSAEPLAWCYGLLRPRVFVTTALVERLSPDPLRAVLLHEWAHAERLDNLRSMLLGAVTLLWPQALRRRIRADLAADNERACDEAARRAMGGSADLRTALRILQGAATPARGAAFGPGGAAARIAALGAGQAAPADAFVRAWLPLAVLWSLQVTLAAGFAHLAMEWFARLF